ncbi:MAG: WD40/YVTN/BNR-like repeat-containing protein [Candidatus Rokuibacteriota bacterium]
MGGLPTKQPVAAFAADPSKTPVMFAALPDGLWKSGDRGQTWQALAKAPSGITALAIHSVDQDRVFAGTAEGKVFRSTDGGVSWQPPR